MPFPATEKLNESAFATGDIAKAVANATTAKLIFFIISLEFHPRERVLFRHFKFARKAGVRWTHARATKLRCRQ
jgi:hypothetical protein